MRAKYHFSSWNIYQYGPSSHMAYTFCCKCSRRKANTIYCPSQNFTADSILWSISWEVSKAGSASTVITHLHLRLQANVPQALALASVDVLLIRKWQNCMMWWINAYRAGLYAIPNITLGTSALVLYPDFWCFPYWAWILSGFLKNLKVPETRPAPAWGSSHRKSYNFWNSDAQNSWRPAFSK